MFYSYEDDKIRYTGRWGKEKGKISATATGAYFEFAFSGEIVSLHFNMENQVEPYPHLWISMDGGARFETVLSPIIKIHNRESGIHTVCVILKSAVEIHHRWYTPLVGKVSLEGITAEKLYELPHDSRKTIEFLGDSITEGVLIDEECKPIAQEWLNRPFQDDACATYAWLTAEKLNLRPSIMGYGASGIVRVGNACVPKACEAYPYNFYASPVTYPEPDYIVINHGANDSIFPAEVYLENYATLLKVIRERCPNSRIFALSCFRGYHAEELKEFIESYNQNCDKKVSFIDSTGWVPFEPLHPLREGHKIISERLTTVLKEML